MISSSALPNSGWAIATPLSGAQANGTPSEWAGSANSFRNIFASAAGYDGGSVAANSSTPAANTAADAPSVSDPVGKPTGASAATDDCRSGAETGGDQVSGRATTNHRAPEQNSQVNAKTVKRLVPPNHPPQADSRAAGSPQFQVVAEGASGKPAGAQIAMPDRTFDVQRTGPAADLMEKPESTWASGPGGSDTLPGAAFALHITPATNRRDLTQKTTPGTTLTVGPVQGEPPADATANPADNTLPDLANVAGVAANSAGLVVNTTLAGSYSPVRSRPVSTPSVGAGLAETGPWSAPNSSHAILHDSARSIEPVTAAAHAAEIEVEDPARAAQPVRTLQFQLGGSGDQRVDLRLVERAGGLLVSVRASDSNLTRGLQDNLPELSARLAAEHYQTQEWLPAGRHSANSSEQPSEQRGGRHSSPGGSSSSGGGGDKQQDRRQNQPPWWRETATPGGTPVPTATSRESTAPNSTISLTTSS